MNTIDIVPGVKIYKEKKYSLLFGCPPEVIKSLIMQKVDFPDYIVLPDIIHHDGVLQNCTEFPLYFYLFAMGKFADGKKLNIVGEPDHLESNKQLLRLTLLGPTLEEYKLIGTSPHFDELYKESRFIGLKGPGGEGLSITDLVNFIPFVNNAADTVDCTIKHKGRNVYEIDGTTIDINFTDKQYPPYDLRFNYVSVMPGRFGVDIMGGGSGFTPNKPCSGMLLNYNSDYMLIDCLPYLEYSLNARGVTKQEIKSIFLSHIHDDHCNIFPLVLFNDKIKFVGTKEIYWMALRKLSFQTMMNMTQFSSYFDFIELKPYEENEFYGVKIVPHYTVHSIPTIGATFSMHVGNRDRKIVFIGDNKSLNDIKEMVEKGIVSRDKYEYLLKLYTERHDILIPDGGMGILHGDPRDSLNSQSDRIVFLHLEELPKEFNATFSLARAGKRYPIVDSSRYTYIVQTIEILNETFPGTSKEWMNTLMNNFNIVEYNSDDVIMKQDDETKGVLYLILSGKCSVVYHDGTKLNEVAVKETGDFVGDMAIIQGIEKRSASIVARTPVTLCEIDGHLFRSFLENEQRIDAIEMMWQCRSELEKNYPFSGFSDFVNEKIAKASERKEIPAGVVVIEEGTLKSEFYIIIEGRFEVIQGGNQVNILSAGEMFGEYASLTDRLRNATVKSLDDSVILEISKQDINSIVSSTPTLNFYLHQIMKERKEEFN